MHKPNEIYNGCKANNKKPNFDKGLANNHNDHLIKKTWHAPSFSVVDVDCYPIEYKDHIVAKGLYACYEELKSIIPSDFAKNKAVTPWSPLHSCVWTP